MTHSLFIRFLTAFSCLFFLHTLVWAKDAGVPADKTMVVLDLEMTGDLSDSSRNAEWGQRRSLMSETLREKLSSNQLYAVIDRARTLRAVEESGVAPPLHACNGCELDIARRLNARYILLGWVFRDSNLILAMHLEIKDASTGQSILRTVLDFRGDNDKSWAKAIDYFVKNLKKRSKASLYRS